ncbi:MAG: AAA family ATPase [Hyphomicrobiaceae bacterium]
MDPIVGREEELSLLLSRWARAKDGEGQVVLLSGETGVGKSQIAQRLRGSITGEAHSEVLCFCWAYHQNSAFYPVLRQLEARQCGASTGKAAFATSQIK